MSLHIRAPAVPAACTVHPRRCRALLPRDSAAGADPSTGSTGPTTENSIHSTILCRLTAHCIELDHVIHFSHDCGCADMHTARGANRTSVIMPGGGCQRSTPVSTRTRCAAS